MPIGPHLEQVDKLTFWTWQAGNLVNLEKNFERAKRLAPRAGWILGCYMWDYGVIPGRPIPNDLMEMQCEKAMRWLREGRIEGIIFLASCICDLDIEAVEWTRRWIERNGDQTL